MIRSMLGHTGKARRAVPVLALLASLSTSGAVFGQGGAAESAVRAPAPAAPAVHYRTVQIEGVDVFYREAGPRDAPVILLLHGFPTSSHMYRDLIPQLADRYRVIAPDYPGFGHSSMPPLDDFAYTFEHLAAVMEQFTQALGLTRYTLYVQDYGAPIGSASRCGTPTVSKR